MISDSSINAIRKFVAERDWSQFHTPGNLAKSISIEAAELLECFQWNDEPQDSNIEHIHEEIADVLMYCIMLSDKKASLRIFQIAPLHAFNGLPIGKRSDEVISSRLS